MRFAAGELQSEGMVLPISLKSPEENNAELLPDNRVCGWDVDASSVVSWRQ